MSDAVLMLGYGTASWRRRWRRTAVGAAVIAVAVATAWMNWSRLGVWHAELAFHYWEHRCATFSLPEETVVYDDDPVRAASLIAGHTVYSEVGDGSVPPYIWPPGYAPAAGFDPPRCVAEVWGHDIFPTVLFSHKLWPPAAPPRLVLLEGHVEDVKAVRSPRTLVLWARSHRLGMSDFYVHGNSDFYSHAGTSASSGAFIRLEPDDVLRLFAGQCVQNDRGAFELRYELNGAPGVLRADLMDSGDFHWTVLAGQMRLNYH